MSKYQFTGTATQPQRNRNLCQFNKDQYCIYNRDKIETRVYIGVAVRSVMMKRYCVSVYPLSITWYCLQATNTLQVKETTLALIMSNFRLFGAIFLLLLHISTGTTVALRVCEPGGEASVKQ